MRGTWASVAAFMLLLWSAWLPNPVSARATEARSLAEPASPRCGNFLAQMHKMPRYARFVGCSYAADRQGKPLRARYHVSGRFAALTEAYLIQATGLNRLRHSCCQWDEPTHAFKDVDGREFWITMVSDETPVGTRSAWRRIPMFEITVETMTEEI